MSIFTDIVLTKKTTQPSGLVTYSGTATVNGEIKPFSWTVVDSDTSKEADAVRAVVSKMTDVDFDTVETIPAPKPAPITIYQVKQEASRRILSIASEIQQRNMLAQSVLLLNKGKANWTTKDQALADSMQAVWDQINLIRTKSNDLETMNPIPVDYADDKHWT